MVSQSAGTVEISWSVPYNGGTAITGYTVFWDQGNAAGDTSTFIEKVADTGLVTTLLIDSELTIDVVYRFAVKAINVIGTGAFSPTVTIRAAGKPDAPAPPTKSTSTTTSITI